VVAKAWSRKYPDRIAYRFKVVNFGRRQAVNVTARATVTRLVDVPGGQRSYVIMRLPVRRSRVEALGPRSTVIDPWGNSPVHVYVTTPDREIEGLLSQNTRVCLTVSATDAVSGVTDVKTQCYEKGDVVCGDYKRGLTFDVEEAPATGGAAGPGTTRTPTGT